MNLLQRGDRSYEVCELQFLLFIALRVPSRKINPDGIFGEITEKAVKLFQKWQKLEITGVVDCQTWNRLLKVTKRKNGTTQSSRSI